MRHKLCAVSLLWLVCLMWSSLESVAQDIESLIKQLGHENQSVRSNATRALGQIGKPAVPTLIKALDDADSSVRYNAAWALGQIGKPAQEVLGR